MLSNPGRGAGVGAKESAGENSDSKYNEKQVAGQGHEETDKHGQEAKTEGGKTAVLFHQFIDSRGTVGAEKVGEKDETDHTLAETIFRTNKTKGNVIEQSHKTPHDGEGDTVKAEQAGVTQFLLQGGKKIAVFKGAFTKLL